jgi:hypothetical protein
MESSSSHQHEDIFFSEVIQERVQEDPLFIERKWLVHRIEQALNDPSCRFVLIPGEPGIGKTTLMAELAHHYPNSLRYFLRVDNQTPYRSGNAQSFLLSIGLQLAARRRELFRPENLEMAVRLRIGDIPSSGTVIGIKARDFIVSPFYQATLAIDLQADNVAGTLIGIDVERMVTDPRLLTPDNLQFLALLDPARVLLNLDPTARIVILIDALDELHINSEQESIVKWLEHCPELPPNVRFVLTSRDDPFLEFFKQRQSRWLKVEKISLTSKEVQGDLYSYTQKFVSQENIKRMLIEYRLDADVFTDLAVAKAQGNFLYLHTLFRAINDTNDSRRRELLLRLEEVPKGLEELYRFFLLWIKHDVEEEEAASQDEDIFTSLPRPFWTRLIQPVLGILAVAGEPLSIEQIIQFSHTQVADRWLLNALGHVRPFLSVASGRYFFYHSTFSEYITSPKTRSNPDHYMCYIGPEEWHRNIVYHYGGNIWPWQDVDWDCLDGYGLRHLSTHMTGAALHQELYDLVTSGEERNRWADIHTEQEGSYAGYLHDLDLVWNWVTDRNGWGLGRQVRCVLIRSSIHSLAATIIPEFLPALIQQRRLTALIAFANIQHIPNTKQRAKALKIVAPLLPEELYSSALREAEAIFNDPTVDEQERLNTLCSVVLNCNLPPELRVRPVRILWSDLQVIHDEGYLAEKIATLWNFFPDDIQARALEKVQKMVKQPYRADALTEIALCCAPEQRAQILALVQTLQDERVRLIAQARLAAYLDEQEKENTLKQALRMTDENVCLAILRNLLPGLAGEQKNLAANKAWAVIQRIADKTQAAKTITGFAEYLSGEQLEAAIKFVREIPLAMILKARTLFQLMEHLPPERRESERGHVRQLVQSVIDSLEVNNVHVRNYLSVLIKLFPYLADEQKQQVLDLAQRIPGRYQRVWVLLEAVKPAFLQYMPDYMQENLIAAIEQLTQVIDDAGERATILAVLAKYAVGPTSLEALQEARHIVEQLPEEQPVERSNKALAWLGLVAYLPPEQQDAAINQAILLLRPLTTPKEIADRLLHFLPNEVLYQLRTGLPIDILTHLEDILLIEGSTDPVQPGEITEDHAKRLSNDHKTAYLCKALMIIRDRGNEKLAYGIIEAISSWDKTGFFVAKESRKLWIDTLRACAHRDRKACINDLIALIPLLLYLSISQEQDEVELLHALQDVERWWH